MKLVTDTAGSPSPAVSRGRGERSPSRSQADRRPIRVPDDHLGERSLPDSQAHRKLIRMPCDQVGERSPSSAEVEESPAVSGTKGQS